jgi:hypothetical protein
MLSFPVNLRRFGSDSGGGEMDDYGYLVLDAPPNANQINYNGSFPFLYSLVFREAR